MTNEQITERSDLLAELLAVRLALGALPNVTSFSRLVTILERPALNGLVDLEEIKDFYEARLTARVLHLEDKFKTLD